MDIATRSEAQASSLDTALSLEMTSVAEGFVALQTSLEELRVSMDASPPLSRLQASMAQQSSRVTPLVPPAPPLVNSVVGGGSLSAPADEVLLSRFNDLEASVREQGHTIEALKVENGELRTLLTATTSPSLPSESSLVDARTTHLRQ